MGVTLRFQGRLGFLIVTGVSFFWAPPLFGDTVAELTAAMRSADLSIRRSAEAKLRTLLKNNFEVTEANLDRAVEKLSDLLMTYERRRKSTSEEYAKYTDDIRQDKSLTPDKLEYYVQRYANQRDGSIASHLYRQFEASPRAMNPAELGAQKAFIKLLLPQFTTLNANGYAAWDLHDHFRNEPLYQVKSSTPGGPAHLFHDEMRELFQAATHPRFSEEGPAEFVDSFKKLLKEDPYGILPKDSKEARMKALADLLIEASANFGSQFNLEQMLSLAQGKTSFFGADKKRVEYEFDKYDLMGQMVKRLAAGDMGAREKAAVSRQVLNALGVNRQGDRNNQVTNWIDWDSIYRNNPPGLNESNALVQAKRAMVLAMMAETVRRDPELRDKPLSPFGGQGTIGRATESMWDSQRAVIESPRRLSEIHCVRTLTELHNGGLHRLTLSTK